MRPRSIVPRLGLALGLLFLYAPLFVLIVNSFNNSQLGSVWGGFTTRWYWKLANDQEILAAAWLSIKIAAVSATVATCLGVLAAIALVRFGLFRGRTLFSALASAPLLMPEVVTALAMLLFFVFLGRLTGWPVTRGTTTIIIAHTTYAMAYVIVVVSARLASMDHAVEEAAADLGSRPLEVLANITLPIIAPAIVAGWLLAFTLSLDDYITTAFTTGPGANTLPLIVWSKVRLGMSPDINALATILILTVVLGILAVAILQARLERHRRNAAKSP